LHWSESNAGLKYTDIFDGKRLA